jgi:hypothetical protein
LSSFTAASTNQVGTGLTPVAENGTIETDASQFVSIVASVNYSGADPLDIAIMLNEVALKEFSSATANSVTLTTTTPTNSGGLISLAVKKPSGSGSTNYTITCNLSVQIL